MFSFFRKTNGNNDYHYNNNKKFQLPNILVSQKYNSYNNGPCDKKIDSSTFDILIHKSKDLDSSIYGSISKFNQDCKSIAVTCGMLFILFYVYRRH